MGWKSDETYMETAPRKWVAIECFDCHVSIPSKGLARALHQGHEVMYTDGHGKIDE